MRFRYFEDFAPGTTLTYGARVVTREEIIAFAREFDDQPMHMDEEAAKNTMLGGLSASGWHSCAILMRMNVDHLLGGTAAMGSPGVSDNRWLKPVRPGDTLAVRMEVTDTRASQSRPEMGLVSFRFHLMNQDGETVMTQETTVMFGREPVEDHA